MGSHRPQHVAFMCECDDVPGALGKVATTMGTVDADISAVEIVEKGDGYAIDDFILSLPTETMPDTLVSTCDQLEGVKVP